MPSKDLIVRIDDYAIRKILKLIGLKIPNETGGILLGYWLSEEEIIITRTVGPGPKAKYGRYSFYPDNEYHISQIAKFYEKSGRKEIYLGDWHSHPNSSAYLSDIDKNTFQYIANFKETRQPNPLMLIVGTNPFEIRCWVFDKNHTFLSNKIHSCTLALV